MATELKISNSNKTQILIKLKQNLVLTKLKLNLWQTLKLEFWQLNYWPNFKKSFRKNNLTPWQLTRYTLGSGLRSHKVFGCFFCYFFCAFLRIWCKSSCIWINFKVYEQQYNFYLIFLFSKNKLDLFFFLFSVLYIYSRESYFPMPSGF